MNAQLRRGLCPTLAEPMQTGDGLLVRLNPVASGFSPKTLIGLCEAALRHGNGVVEVTSRGSFQIRGLTARSAVALSRDVDALGIAVHAGVPVETGPLAGLDPDEIADPTPLAENIRKGIAAAGLEQRLGPKVSVIVDGGGRPDMDDVMADVRLTAARGDRGVAWQLGAAGSAVTAREFIGDLTEDAACTATLSILAAVAGLGREGRARDLKLEQLNAATSAIEVICEHAPPSVLPEGGVEKHQATPALNNILPLTDSRFAVSMTLPFGQGRAEGLIGFVGAAERLGAAEIRLAPRRALLLICLSRTAAENIQQAARTAGFITDPADPRTRIAACPGSPACASGHIPARAIAAEIAASMPDGLSLDLHVTGCEKRCARPGHQGLTILGRPDSAAFVLGRAGAAPLARVAREHAATAFGRVAKLIAAERKPGETETRCLYRLGKRRLAQAFVGER